LTLLCLNYHPEQFVLLMCYPPDFLSGLFTMTCSRKVKNKEIAQLEVIMESWKERVQAGEPDADLDEEFHRILYQTLNNNTLI